MSAASPSSARSPALALAPWWKDARFVLMWLMPLGTLLNVVVQPSRAAAWAVFTLALIATLDALWPGGRQSPPASVPRAWHTVLLRGYVALQAVIWVVGAWAAQWAAQTGDWATVLGVAFAVGFVCGSLGITYAHELGHRKHPLDRALAWLLMGSVLYGHFMVEHYRGHHPRAATHDDPASARRGESLWRFLPRTLWGSWASAWRLQAADLAQRRRLRQQAGPVSLREWLQTPLVQCTAAWACVLLALAVLQMWAVLAYVLVLSAVAVGLLETINYVEHYGLQRRTDANGRREPFGQMHAWNADHAWSNALLANLQRHSDHHMHAYKPFPTLEPLPGPQLPTGYAGCVLLALVPPWWFAVMHRRLDALPGA
jgi:alkane 1-monooxygenase